MTATALRSTKPREAGKQRGVFKKMIKYLQDQAVENSNSRSFVQPPGPETQHNDRPLPPDIQQDQNGHFIWSHRRLSDASTAVDQRGRPGAMAGDGADAGVLHESLPSGSKEMKKVQYAQDNILQNYRIYIPEQSPDVPQGDQYWIIYIHGGYFRDPKIDAMSFRPALEMLTTSEGLASRQTSSLDTVPESATPSPSHSSISLDRDCDLVQRHVAGYVSINYRLSPHPGYSQNEKTENYVKRDAEFPQQVQDVHAAIRHLQGRYNITDNYILAGHSVGATLAFLAALGATEGQIDPPTCVVGLNGIYDFPHFHEKHPECETMTRNAVRPEQYRTASPALYSQPDYLSITNKRTLRILLSHSKDDGLVDWDQVERMQRTLLPDAGQTHLHVELLETKGQHDKIWKDGKELARTLTKAMRMVTDY